MVACHSGRRQTTLSGLTEISGFSTTSMRSGRMRFRGPAPHLHMSRARVPGATRCFQCITGQAQLLHHDHLMDFALEELWRLGSHLDAAAVSLIWQASAPDFFKFVRFRPFHLCRTCNEGDGWAKVPNWCGVPWSVYPPSFSMKPKELEDMRSPPKGLPRRRLAEEIWYGARKEHFSRRGEIRALAGRIVSSPVGSRWATGPEPLASRPAQIFASAVGNLPQPRLTVLAC